MDKQELKRIICDTIDSHRDKIIGIGKKVLMNPELGFKEFKTAETVKEIFSKLGLDYKDKLALTGVKAYLRGKNSRTKVAVMGEMDAVLCPMHPYADSGTGAAHSCGHNAQIAAMLGAAIGFVKSGSKEYLDGDVVFMAVPAEEFVELEYRERLKKDGKITFLGGKQELIHKGAFDDIDMAMMVHCQPDTPERKAYIKGGSTGFIGKTVRFKGKEAHAGGEPHLGINALNAAMAALMCIHAQRETFRDEDHIRVHPIITKGGDLVNIVPADVRMETFVRGKTMDAVLDANRKVNRAIRGAAYAIGAEVTITEFPGYLPMVQDDEMGDLFKINATQLIGEENIIEGVDMVGSTDIGDLGSIMPVIQPNMGGVSGDAHSQDYEITDEEAVYITPAKIMAMTVIDLLWNGAEKAIEIKKNFKPRFTRESYLKFMDDIVNA
jgi:amidohydrolase